MHIPDSMLQGNVCSVTAVASVLGLVAATYYGLKGSRPSASRFAAVTALIFAAQMMNFPVQHGTSGHLLGGVLAATLLGTPFGVLAVALVVVIQSLVFADGGVTVLGANVLNMALIGAGLGGWLRTALATRTSLPGGSAMATAVAAWASVMLAALAVSVQLAVDGQIAFSQVIGAMLASHSLIGIGEAAITVVACLFIPAATQENSARGQVAMPLGAATIIALVLSPFASGWPDGLEWVAEKYAFLHESAPLFVGPLPDYTVPAISHEMLSTSISGLIGIVLSFAVAWALHQGMTHRRAQPQRAA
jgi:cobalt/nickel transport system permease protein